MTNDTLRTRPLVGKTALVTGGASGLGRAISERLAADGADIVILTLPDPRHDEEIKYFAGDDEVHSLKQVVEGLGCRFEAVEGDAASPDDIGRATSQADRLGGVDILINNAGTNCFHPVAGHDIDAWRRVVDVDLVGPFLAIRACLPGMHERRFGRIVSIASTNAHVGSAGYSAYCAAKHGLLGLHKAVAQEVDATCVTLVTVSPAWLDTPSSHLHMTTVSRSLGIETAEYRQSEIERQPQRRIIMPAEVAELVAFLVGPHGRLIHDSDVLATAGASL